MSIVINYPMLLIALGLLYFPRQWLRWGKRVLKSEHKSRNGATNDFDPSGRREMGDPAVVFKDEFVKLRNFVDLLRGLAGSAVIVGTPYTTSCLTAGAGATADTAKIILGIKCALMLGAMLAQLVRIERRVTLFAPIFFLGGLTFGLCGGPTAGFAFILVWTINLALPNPTAFLGVHAVLIVLFGLLFNGTGNALLTVTAFLCLFLPVLISLLAQRPLLLFNRRG